MTGAEQVEGLLRGYRDAVVGHLDEVVETEAVAIAAAAELVADRVASDELVHIYGPGGHSNLSAQEVFFRAGGIVNISAILDEGTLLSSGALRSMAMERAPGYGRIVMADNGLAAGDLLVLVNAYGINAALVDAALWAREHDVTTIGVSSRRHAEQTAPDHPARHPGRHDLHDLVDVHLDCKVPVGDALMELPGLEERMGAVSTFANAFVLNVLMLTTASVLVERGVQPTIWRSGNAPGGDDQHAAFLDRYRARIRWL